MLTQPVALELLAHQIIDPLPQRSMEDNIMERDAGGLEFEKPLKIAAGAREGN